MGFAGSLLKGFLAMTAAIWIFNVTTVIVLRRVEVTWSSFPILLTTLFMLTYEYLKYRRNGIKEVDGFDTLKQILVSLYGISFACWALDIGTTLYAIDVLGIATEQNPLGWPFGALGAMIYYIPTLTFAQLILSKIRRGYSSSVAVLMAALVLWFGDMNLMAGLQNLALMSGYYAYPSAEAYAYLFYAVVAAGFGYAMVSARVVKLARPLG
jgi:hypothetical protein